MDSSIILWIIALILIVIGIAGLVLPAVPGSPVLFAGLFIAAWADQFRLRWLADARRSRRSSLLTYVADFAATAFGAMIGAVLGLFFGFLGVLIGPFVGAVIGELSWRRDLQAAARAGIGATIGLAIGVAAKLALAFSMVGIFVVARFF